MKIPRQHEREPGSSKAGPSSSRRDVITEICVRIRRIAIYRDHGKLRITGIRAGNHAAEYRGQGIFLITEGSRVLWLAVIEKLGVILEDLLGSGRCGEAR
jgi:hypothetical protein